MPGLAVAAVSGSIYGTGLFCPQVQYWCCSGTEDAETTDKSTYFSTAANGLISGLGSILPT